MLTAGRNARASRTARARRNSAAATAVGYGRDRCTSGAAAASTAPVQSEKGGCASKALTAAPATCAASVSARATSHTPLHLPLVAAASPHAPPAATNSCQPQQVNALTVTSTLPAAHKHGPGGFSAATTESAAAAAAVEAALQPALCAPPPGREAVGAPCEHACAAGWRRRACVAAAEAPTTATATATALHPSGAVGAAAQGGDQGGASAAENVDHTPARTGSTSSTRSSSGDGGGGGGGGGGAGLVVMTPLPPATPRPPPDVRSYTDGRSATYRQPMAAKLLAQVTFALYVGWLYVLLFLLVASARGSVLAITVLALLLGSLLLPAQPLRWQGLLDSWLFRLWRDYFNYSIVHDGVPDLSRPYIYVHFPHGAFPLSQIIGSSLGSQLWPGHHVYCLAASAVFWIPGWRHVKSWIGAAPADKATAKRLLTTRGSVCILAGGIAEMYEGGSGTRELIKLKGRKGFARLACELGVDIVPVYHFGNTQVLSFGPAWLQGIGRRWRVALGVVTGIWGLPVPRQAPLCMAIGRPIRVERTDPWVGGEERERNAQQVLDRVVAAVQDLYERRRPLYGWEHRPLEVV